MREKILWIRVLKEKAAQICRAAFCQYFKFIIREGRLHLRLHDRPY